MSDRHNDDGRRKPARRKRSKADDEASARRLMLLLRELTRSLSLYGEIDLPHGERIPVSWAHCLVLLLECDPEWPTLREMANDLGIDKSNVTRLSRRMVTAGDITLEPSPSDGRAKLMRLTASGRARAEAVDAESFAVFQEIMDGIRRIDTDNMLADLQALVVSVSKVRAKRRPEEDAERAMRRLGVPDATSPD